MVAPTVRICHKEIDMKKAFALLLALVLTLSCVAGCGKEPAETQPTTAQDKWEQVFGGGLLGTANQPLVIYNPYHSSQWETVPFATKSYGFVGATQTIAANTYAAVSLRVKASAGAKAYIYLIDTDDTSLKNTLSVSGKLTYWYDDDGNVCASDPLEKNFDDAAIAFKRQSNGL